MGWKGIAIGGGLGFFLGRGGILSTLLGAWIGYGIEERYFPARTSDSQRSMVFCASVAAMLAKIAKADGHVSADEIASVEQAFRRLGFSPAARAYAVKVFRKAKDDSRSIYQYAADFSRAVNSIEVRELLYELLWDIACADGRISPAELEMLRLVPRALGIRADWFHVFASMRMGGETRDAARPARDSLADAYGVLGADASDSDETLKRKYRELAKRNHPDALRAQGLPEAMVGKATERMSRINAAWAEVRAARGL